jgi:hypothetical protein
MKLTITLDNETYEQLKDLANHCGLSDSAVAEILLKDSTDSFSRDKDEFRESLNP